ncbi:ImmA/IrrE family metallo-endopeptidase [Amycolatopsis rhizosphaerae]|uniref:ImmA/IrrE family metallo-endopeptidase n=1 Tax=Amycolatopsis rhizosphaerae TaxID=2053003 RepID=A0A558DLV7_9PSEU|nr:ImmA/IrrE family metallo-endopeptidase [Amycolatopsis rhizosphaerae]TVT61963.1 ImmA/IrrE family metallo-endopeptidase [Amycolatopsis rhizosphaerae]
MKRDCGTWRSDLALRREVKQLLRELQIDAPLNVRVLCERLAQRRGRPIKLIPYPLPAPGVFGLWIGTIDADYIVYQKNTTPAHQEHIILHEIGHIISGHSGYEEDGDLWSQFFPDIPPDMVHRALRREGYGPAFEREAEMVATVVKDWATLLDRLGVSRDRMTDAGRRLQGAFDDHQGWF